MERRLGKLARGLTIFAFGLGTVGCDISNGQENQPPTEDYCTPGLLPEEEKEILRSYGYEEVPEENVHNLSKFGMPTIETFCPQGIPPTDFEGNLSEFLNSGPAGQTEPVPLPPTPAPVQDSPQASPTPTMPAVETQPTAQDTEQQPQAPQQSDEGWLKNAQEAARALAYCSTLAGIALGALAISRLKSLRRGRQPESAPQSQAGKDNTNTLREIRRTAKSYKEIHDELNAAKKIFAEGDPNSPEVEAAKKEIPILHQEALELGEILYQIGQDINTGTDNETRRKREEQIPTKPDNFIGGSDDY